MQSNPAKTQENLLNFHVSFYKGEFPHQRLGQAFCNHFSIKNSAVFYEENIVEATSAIFEIAEQWQKDN